MTILRNFITTGTVEQKILINRATNPRVRISIIFLQENGCKEFLGIEMSLEDAKRFELGTNAYITVDPVQDNT